jgi:uncharacterized protein YaaN involved in tellurite resistance
VETTIDKDKEIVQRASVEAPEVAIPDPKLPKNITANDQKRIEVTAVEAINKIKTLEGSQQLDYVDQIANVGFKAQQEASSKLDLFQVKMGKVFDSKEASSQKISNDILVLRESLRRINPSDIKREWIVQIISWFPGGNSLLNVLRKIDLRRQSVEGVITTIEKSLQNGRDMLAHDNAELSVLHKDLENTQVTIQKNAYLAEVMSQKLKEAIAASTDAAEQSQYKNVLFRVVTRDQDLRAMEETYEQFFVSIKITRENNNLLMDTVQRMLTLGMNVVTVAFAIHVALMRQHDVKVAVEGTRDFIGNLLMENAATIKRHVKEIGDLYKQPIIAIESIEKAHNDLLQAIDMVDQYKTTGIQTAEENIIRLKALSEEMRIKSTGTQAGVILSLEAGDAVKALPSGV